MLKMKLHEAISEYRLEAGMSTRDLAEAIGSTYSYISYIERGTRVPTLERLGEISDALGVMAWEIVRKAEEKV